MKKYYRLLGLLITILIVFVFTEKLISQPDPPPMPDQHGINGTPSPEGAPLDGGSGILLFLGIVYGITKVTGSKRVTITER